MIDVVSIYDDVAKDAANKEQNGDLSPVMFNRLSKRAELRLIDWLSGAVDGLAPPAPWLTQKNKDWLSPFIKKYSAHVAGGIIIRPEDYYQYENFYRLGASAVKDCDDDEDEVSLDTSCNTPIELLDGVQFHDRCNTSIRGLRPSDKKPISKMVGETFEVMPSDLGPVTLDYIRMPQFAELVTKFDPVYNDVVPDSIASKNYEWSEAVWEYLVAIIADLFFNSTREQAGKQFNQASAKTKP